MNSNRKYRLRYSRERASEKFVQHGGSKVEVVLVIGGPRVRDAQAELGDADVHDEEAHV